MQAPSFWFRPVGWQARMLAPLARLYAAATVRRVAQAPKVTPGIPVICIGNINAGGTGKTPATIALVERLIGRGHKPFVLSRGYGGREEGPVLVDPARHDAAAVGDEPLLHAAFAPTVVARDRAAGARLAEKAGASVIVMDDGHQNPAVAKSLSIVTVSARGGFGNGRVIPAGPLREPLDKGLARADLLLVTAQSEEAASRAVLPTDLPCPVIHGIVEPLQMGMPWSGLRAVAFAGIGQPEAFFATLHGLGVKVLASHALGDHETIPSALFDRLLREAAEKSARLVTTEKDAARLEPAQRREVLTLPVRLRMKDDAPLVAALEALGL